LFFCALWLIAEYITNFLFTGLPWAQLGYSLTFSDEIIQIASFGGIWILSFIVVFVGSVFTDRKNIYSLFFNIIISLLMIGGAYWYGHSRLENNPTQYSDVTVRLVQPSIKQSSKWSPEKFWSNLERHVNLSTALKEGEESPDIIVWSEAALTAPCDIPAVRSALKEVFANDSQILITGGLAIEKSTEGSDDKLYSSMIALNSNAKQIFSYHKSHLVPFGEYIPYADFLPLKKLTPGLINYTSGTRKIVYLKEYNLKILPLICYESIFSEEVRSVKDYADIIINITNDAWYGNSSGPYQHFQISRLRAVENNIPEIRVGNNGISAIIDSYGRVVSIYDLNNVGYLQGKLPIASELRHTLLNTSLEPISILVVFIVFLLVGKLIFLLNIRKPNIK
jgi:apolipoprotein N-acyltransferase